MRPLSFLPFLCIACRQGSTGLLCAACKENLEALYLPDINQSKEGLSIHWAYIYGGIPKALIEAIKLEGLRAPTKLLAELIAPLLPAGAIIAPVPASPSGIKKRGFDHMELVARQLKKRGHVVLQPFVRARGMELKRVKRDERSAEAITLRPGWAVAATAKKRELWIIDDICTTGTTLRRCVGLLEAEGWTVHSAVCMLVLG